MRHLPPLLARLMSCAALLEGTAFGQDTSPDTVPRATADSAATSPSDPLYRPYDQSDLDEVARQGLVLRKWLIGTSVGLAVGTILVGAGASQCESFSRVTGSNRVACNNAGEVLVPLGATIAVLSAVGMLTSGVMLGIRNRQKRDIEREIRRRYSNRRLHFDAQSGGWVF
ncbi:MAG: hypothetical protein HKN10_18185 [Myxococcales bacterium]|nr:hypothetical protein [Myxococcales bacterium]